MADRNLARMIWELSQQEENNDAEDLKRYFKKKVKSSPHDLQNQLKEMVFKRIQKETQPAHSRLALITQSVGPLISGGVVTDPITIVPSPGQKIKYSSKVYKSLFGGYTPAEPKKVVFADNKSSQELIDCIHALDLRYIFVESLQGIIYIVVKWEHWPTH